MIYGKVEGTYKKVNGIYRNVAGIVKEVNIRYEKTNGIAMKVYHPWVLVKNGKLINHFHFIFANQYNQTIVDLKDYTNLYEDENGVWIELTKRYQYTGYLPNRQSNARFIICLSIEGCETSYTIDNYKMSSSYRSVYYQCSKNDTFWGMFPFSAGGDRKEDYHLDTTAVNGTWTTIRDNASNENCIINGKSYPSIVGIQANYSGTRTATYNSLKLCIRDFYAYSGEMV